MWLLDTNTCELHYFLHAEKAPPYAILSHTWGDEEVSFKDMDDMAKARAKQGWSKTASTCQQAQDDNLNWAWVDTCCIDKSSSASPQWILHAGLYLLTGDHSK